MTASAFLTISGIEKRYGELVLLAGISAHVARGSVTAFIGPNGAGKTTLFHTVSGDLVPDAGEVRLAGRPITGLAPWRIARRGLGKLFQDVRVFRQLTVLENVVLAVLGGGQTSALDALVGGSWMNSSRSLLESEAEGWLERLDLSGHRNKLAGDLSFGNQKLLAFARLMAGDFSLLLLDEPTAGLSSHAVERLQKILLHLVETQDKTVALIEHNFDFVARMADCTYAVVSGAIYAEGKTADVLHRSDIRDLCMGL